MRRASILFLFVAVPLLTLAQSDIINNSYYGVPSSPAFELLPDKPSEVTHVLTPKDFSTYVPLTLDGTSLKSGIGFDVRPGSFFVGSLKSYQENPWKQVLWRSVLSGGTASIKDSKDVYLALGIKLSLIDKGDPRANRKYIHQLEDVVTNDTSQPDFDSPDLTVINASVTRKLDSLRKEFIQDNWNAFRLDVGIGNMWLLQSANIKPDSLNQDRIGIWIAMSQPIGKKAQLMLSAKNAWNTTAIDTLETGHSSAGMRLRLFLNWFALSVEYAHIWSNFSKETILSDNWNHFATLVEIPIPKLKGVLGITYGGDTGRRESSNSKLELKYSFYADQLLKRE